MWPVSVRLCVGELSRTLHRKCCQLRIVKSSKEDYDPSQRLPRLQRKEIWWNHCLHSSQFCKVEDLCVFIKRKMFRYVDIEIFFLLDTVDLFLKSDQNIPLLFSLLKECFCSLCTCTVLLVRVSVYPSEVILVQRCIKFVCRGSRRPGHHVPRTLFWAKHSLTEKTSQFPLLYTIISRCLLNSMF